MKYSEARDISNRTLSDLIVEKLLSNESIGRSIGSSITQKISAKRTRIKEKFDPLNVVKFLSGGSSLPSVLLGRMMGRSMDDIQHFAGNNKKRRTKDPLYSNINSSSVVPLKRDDGVTDIVTKMYVLLKKSHERKKKEELALLKQERKIRKQSDENLKAMINGLLPKDGGKGAGEQGADPFKFITDMLKNAGNLLLATGGGVLAAGAGAWAARKALMKKPKKPSKPPKPSKPSKPSKPTGVDEPDKPKVEEKEKPKEKPKKTEKGTGKASRQKKVPTRGSDRFKKTQAEPVESTIKDAEPPPTAEKVESKSPKVSKAILSSLKIFRAVGVVGTVASLVELNDLYEKHKKGDITDHEARNELIKIMASGLGGTGGAALGAALGSLVAPLAGTIVGGLAGGVGGTFYAEQVAKKAVDYLGDNDIPTSIAEIQNMSKQYVKEHGGDQWGTDETIGQWFERNTIGRSREYVKEHGGDKWGTDQTKSEWFSGLLTELKNYIDRSVAEQLSTSPNYTSRYNDAMSQNERLSIDSIVNQPIVNTSNNFNTSVLGKQSYQINGEQKVRNDQLSNYR